MPSAGAMYNWVRDRPDFAAKVAFACQERELWYLDRVLEIVERMPGGLAATRRAIAPLNSQRARLRKRPGWKRPG